MLLFLSYGVSFAQWGSAEKSALKNMEKGRWTKAESRLRKSLARESISPSLRYGLSVFYFHPENPAFDLDSAYHYAVWALGDYGLSPARERDKLRRAGVDSLALISLRARIDSTAFEVARQTNTEAAYLEFLSHFPSAVQRDLAAQLRDEVAYQDALRENSYRAFNRYLTRYPHSKRATEALAQYHRLLYLEETKDKRLTSYEKFLTDHPETPYRAEVYRRIFEISTADGKVESFLSFMTRYPVSDLVKKAGQMIFHILAEQDDPRWPRQFLNDSLRNLLEINNIYLVPFLKEGHYGFIDEKGAEIIAPIYRSIHPEYLCGHVTDEVLIADSKLVARNGSLIFHGHVTEVTDLGAGFLKINTETGVKIVHKAGFIFADSVEDARIISKSFVALKKSNKWFIYTLAGKQLDARPWMEITAFDDVIIFSGDTQKFIARKEQLARCAEAVPLTLSEPFDEIKQWPQGLIWGRAGDFQGVLDQSLQGVIGFDKHFLTQTSFGAIARLPNGIAVYNLSGRKSQVFDQVNIVSQRVAVRRNRAWYFYDPFLQEMQGAAFDSLRAEGPFVVASRGDTVLVYFSGNVVQSFFKPQKVFFVPGMDSTSFLVVQGSAREKHVFDLAGRKLFAATFDAMEYAGKGMFVITRRDRKGLLSSRGESLLPAEFDAIGSVKEQVVSVLKNRKFGAYHINTRKFIKPQYDRNPVPYTSSALVTFKDGFYGFLGWDNKPMSSYEFEEVTYWNDSLALVKKGGLWNLYDIYSRRISEGNLKDIKLIREDNDEKLAIVQKDKSFGVISSRGEVVIPITFSDVINLGSSDAPLYFTEKHITEASLYVVIYYDRSGNMLRKEIYDDAGDYDRIYCSDQ